MESKIRAVLDTNVLVSALIRPRGASAKIRRAGDAGLFTIVLSEVMLEELRDVLSRPRIMKAGQYGSIEASEFLELLQLTADVIPGPPYAPPILAADPDDDWVLATAIQGEAGIIVSGDLELLKLAAHQGVRIMTPADFLEELKPGAPS